MVIHRVSVPTKKKIRKALKAAGLAQYRHCWEHFKMMCNVFYGRGAWRITPRGVSVNGEIKVPVEDYKIFVENMPRDTNPEVLKELSDVPKEESEPQTDALKSDDPKPQEEISSKRTEEVEIEADDEKPTFKCSKRGCDYVGYTEKALKAHKTRMDH